MCQFWASVSTGFGHFFPLSLRPHDYPANKLTLLDDRDIRPSHPVTITVCQTAAWHMSKVFLDQEPSAILPADHRCTSKSSQNHPNPAQVNRLVSNNKCLLFSVTEFWGDLLHSNTWLIHLLMTGWCNTSRWAFRYFISQIDWIPAIYITRIVPGSVDTISLPS